MEVGVLRSCLPLSPSMRRRHSPHSWAASPKDGGDRDDGGGGANDNAMGAMGTTGGSFTVLLGELIVATKETNAGRGSRLLFLTSRGHGACAGRAGRRGASRGRWGRWWDARRGSSKETTTTTTTAPSTPSRATGTGTEMAWRVWRGNSRGLRVRKFS